MDKKTVFAIFECLQQHNPHPITELVYHSPFELLIAVILSAQSTDVAVNKVTQPLFAVAQTPEALFAMGEAGLKLWIQSIGLYHTKAANIIKTCHLLITRHQSRVPSTREALEALPGVGRKTANVVLNTAFGHPTIAVDTHVFRVARRLGLAEGATPLAVEQALLACIPDIFLKDAHHWLVLHGRYVCTARKPQCETCVLRAWCEHPCY